MSMDNGYTSLFTGMKGQLRDFSLLIDRQLCRALITPLANMRSLLEGEKDPGGHHRATALRPSASFFTPAPLSAWPRLESSQCPTYHQVVYGHGSLPLTKVRDVLPGFVSQSLLLFGCRGQMLLLSPVFFLCFLFQNSTDNLLLPEFLLLFKSPMRSASQIRAGCPFLAPASWAPSGYQG